MDVAPFYLAVALTVVTGSTVLALIALKAFRAWLDLKHMELGRDEGPPGTARRIDVADLKERVRKLEAIAAGVDI